MAGVQGQQALDELGPELGWRAMQRERSPALGSRGWG